MNLSLKKIWKNIMRMHLNEFFFIFKAHQRKLYLSGNLILILIQSKPCGRFQTKNELIDSVKSQI